MDHTPAYIIAKYLIGEALLSDPSSSGDWPVYVGALPDSPEVVHDAVGCMDTTGVKDGRVMGGLPLFHHGVQLMVRAEEYNAGYAKAQVLADALGGVDNDTETIEEITYEINNVTQTTDVVVVGQEEGSKRRELFSINFLVALEEI